MTISSLNYSHMATILMQPILDMARKVTPSPDRAAHQVHCPLCCALSTYAPTDAFSCVHCAPEDQLNKLAKRTRSQQLRSASKPTPQIQCSSRTGYKPCEPADPRRVMHESRPTSHSMPKQALTLPHPATCVCRTCQPRVIQDLKPASDPAGSRTPARPPWSSHRIGEGGTSLYPGFQSLPIWHHQRHL